MILGVSGDIGSFSEEAALKYLQINSYSFELNYLIDPESVLASLENKSIQYGIFPVVNRKGGLVKTAFEAMGKYNFQYINEVVLEINHNLITKHKMCLSEIKTIVSHSQAFAQCQKYLKSNFSNINFVDWKNTALAARHLSEGYFDLNTAIIAHKSTAKIYNLNVLTENIQDESPNLTSFIVVSNL